jgi:uncharacterized membrane protein YfcA
MELGSISLWLAAIVLLAIAIGSLIKGMTGLGLPLIAVPAIASFTSVEEAVVLMIIPVLGSNIWLVVSHRKFGHLLRAHWPFLVAGFIGAIGGTFLLVAIDDRWLKLILAGWLALYLLQYAFGDALSFVFRARGAASGLVGFAAGTIQGASGVSAHIVAPYFHGRQTESSAYAFLIAAAFLTFGSAQLVTASGNQLFDPGRLILGLLALIPTLFFTQLGIRWAGRVSDDVFRRIILALFVLMEIKLLADVWQS